MARIIGLLVLFLVTLTLGGCAGMPLDLNGYGNGASGYGGSCPQPYGASMVPMAPGYAMAAPPVVYVPQPQPYYAPQPYAYNYHGATAYAPADRIRQGRRDGSLTPQEAQRQWAEQRHLRGAEGRMSADGNRSPYNRGRLNTMQNRANQDIYGARHNGMAQPGAAGPQRGNGPADPMGHARINGGQMQAQPQVRSMQSQTRPTQAGVTPSRSIAATPGQ